MELDQVELVSPSGVTTGSAPKLHAHLAPGELHRAVSVFVTDDNGRALLQRRASDVYHFADRWSNACCTHPRPGERPHSTAVRRLYEEMGIRTHLTEIGTLSYRAEDPATGLVENEYDHVFSGRIDGSPRPNSRLVSDWMWIDIGDLRHQLISQPDTYTPWLPLVLEVIQSVADHAVPD